MDGTVGRSDGAGCMGMSGGRPEEAVRTGPGGRGAARGCGANGGALAQKSDPGGNEVAAAAGYGYDPGSVLETAAAPELLVPTSPLAAVCPPLEKMLGRLAAIVGVVSLVASCDASASGCGVRVCMGACVGLN
jgi:hypothetical protein